MVSELRTILAFDTTFAACSAAVHFGGDAGGEWYSVTRHEAMTTGHAERLFPMIDEIMHEADVGYDKFDALAVTIGPGTFTGTRVGIAAVRGLALATGLPVYGATSLAVIAASAGRQTGLPGGDATSNGQSGVQLIVCMDARRGQVYYQAFDDPAGSPLCEAMIDTVDGVADALVDRRQALRLVGSGAGAVADRLTGRRDAITCGPEDILPSAGDLVHVALKRLEPPRPLYLRSADARPQVGKAIPRI